MAGNVISPNGVTGAINTTNTPTATLADIANAAKARSAVQQQAPAVSASAGGMNPAMLALLRSQGANPMAAQWAKRDNEIAAALRSLAQSGRMNQGLQGMQGSFGINPFTGEPLTAYDMSESAFERLFGSDTDKPNWANWLSFLLTGRGFMPRSMATGVGGIPMDAMNESVASLGSLGGLGGFGDYASMFSVAEPFTNYLGSMDWMSSLGDSMGALDSATEALSILGS